VCACACVRACIDRERKRKRETTCVCVHVCAIVCMHLCNNALVCLCVVLFDSVKANTVTCVITTSESFPLFSQGFFRERCLLLQCSLEECIEVEVVSQGRTMFHKRHVLIGMYKASERSRGNNGFNPRKTVTRQQS